jgi:protoporphyrinogen oxidase
MYLSRDLPAEIESVILGAGPAGLGLASVTGWPILEARTHPGGICSSYYVSRTGAPVPGWQPNADCYRFEHGGGHWLFGLNDEMGHFLAAQSELEYFERDSAVFFANDARVVPYPIQQNLDYLPLEAAHAAQREIAAAAGFPSSLADISLAQWLQARYGPTLCRLFFTPFHDLYSCGLQNRISAQDEHKSPIPTGTPASGTSGYNARFAYPKRGLDDLFRRLAAECAIYYESQVTHIDVQDHLLTVAGGARVRYGQLFSTLPLSTMLEYTNLQCRAEPDPSIAVHVLNIGGRKGPRCFKNHWVYLPHSRSGFHRVGFYSNVDTRFLPESVREGDTHVALYVERCFLESAEAPANSRYESEVIKELKSWQVLESVEVVSSSVVPIGYTWSWLGSSWKCEAFQTLERAGIVQLGRYGRWKFQGIGDSLAEGMRLGKELTSVR